MALLTKGATLKLDTTIIQGVKSMGEISESKQVRTQGNLCGIQL